MNEGLAVRLLVVALAGVTGVVLASIPVSTALRADAAVATEGVAATSGSPTPSGTDDYDSKVGGPHQDTSVESTGRAVTTGRLVAIIVVAGLTIAVVVFL